MPLYEYQCSGCGEVFDDILSIANRNIPTESPCPSCGEIKVIQKIGVIPIADPVRLGHIKAPEGFRDILRNVKKQFRGSKINVN